MDIDAPAEMHDWVSDCALEGTRMVDTCDRATFVAQVRRRRGPKKRVPERVPTSVKLPLPVFNALCRRALARGESLHGYMLRTLKSAVAAELR